MSPWTRAFLFATQSAPLLAASTGFMAQFTAGLTAQAGAVQVADTKVTQEPLTYSDAVAFKAWSTGTEVFFEVEMNRPLIEGMFTCLHVYIDGDNKPETGIDGAEMWLRGALGSRYHPNDFKPKDAKNEPPAMQIRKASWSRIERGQTLEGRPALTWLHAGVLPEPEIGAKTIRFKVGTDVLRKSGGRYGSVVGIRAEVETTCTDQPLMVRHLCNDEGVPIGIDGNDEEWSHPIIASDPAGELHKVAQLLDLTSLRAEHDKAGLFACVRLAAEGIARNNLDTSDIERWDGVTFYVEPMYPRYQDPMKIYVRYGQARQPAGFAVRGALRGRAQGGTRRRFVRYGFQNPFDGWQAGLANDTIELRVDRKSGQNEFRVWAWSDLRRFDLLPDEEWLKLDWGKSK